MLSLYRFIFNQDLRKCHNWWLVRDAISLILTFRYFYSVTHPTGKICQLRKSYLILSGHVVNMLLANDLKGNLQQEWGDIWEDALFYSFPNK